MRIRTLSFYSLILVLFLFALNACKSSAFIPIKKTLELPLDTLWKALQSHNYDFSWFESKGKLNYKLPEESGSAVCRIRMKKDSVIWMQIKKLGVEASRVLIRPDSFFIIYRLDRKFERGSLEDFERFHNIEIEFSWLQDLIFGNIRLPADPASVELLKDPVYHKFSGPINESISGEYSLTGDLLAHKIQYTESPDRYSTLYYEDYKRIKNFFNFSYLRKMYFPLAEGGLSTAKYDISDVDIDVVKSIKFKIPEGYEEIN